MEITLENLEREKRDRQADLHTLEEKIAALRAEEGRLGALQKENERLYDRAEALKAELAECQKKCVPPPPPKMKDCAVDKGEFDHWDEKQKKYPSQANKNRRDAALKKLCECLKAHPGELTPELKKLCPDTSTGMVPRERRTPAKLGECLVGFVYSADARPNESVCGTLVDDPKDYEGSPRVRVIEIPARLPVDDSGRPILGETRVTVGDGPAQPADGPVNCRIPPDGRTSSPSADRIPPRRSRENRSSVRRTERRCPRRPTSGRLRSACEAAS